MLYSASHTGLHDWLKLCAALVITICAQVVVLAEPAKPILVSTPSSTRAIALDAVTQLSEPFSATTQTPYTKVDRATRLMLFAMNLNVQAGESPSVVTAEAEDAAHRRYTLKVEYIGKVPGQEWLSQLNLRLDESMGDVGDVLVMITYQGMTSNRVRIGIGHVGGGLPDDSGAVPTPAPIYTISGQIVAGTAGLSGVSVALSGAQAGTTTTDENGNYSFKLTAPGECAVTPSKKFYNFSPSARTFNQQSGNQTGVNFTAAKETYAIGGQVQDDQGKGVDEMAITLKSSANESSTTVVKTSNGGRFSFSNLSPGLDYWVTPAGNSLYVYATQGTNSLEGNLSLIFSGTRRKYAISGVVTDGENGLGGVTVTLGGGNNLTPLTAITSVGGQFSFRDVTAGYDYTVMPAMTSYYTFNSQDVKNLQNDQDAYFRGTLRTYTISGLVTDENDNPLSTGTMALVNGNNTVTLGTRVGADGHYEFKNVPALYGYTIYPYYVPTHYFNAIDVPILGSDRIINFRGIRYRYTLSGVVADRSQRGVSDVEVTLSGPVNRTTVTDANGNYSFPDLPAGFDYQMKVGKTDYIFEPATLSSYLLKDEKADFTAIRTYRISGRVTDGSGHGLTGVTMSLSGAETGKALTSGDGTYSFTVTTVGNYLVTPSKEQNFYTFSPASQSFINLSEHQTAVFTAAFSPATNPGYVLEFDGSPMTVDFDLFWPEGQPLGHFFWEFWAMPGQDTSTKYLMSDGYGGAHALLFGFDYGVEGHYNLFGNIWDGSTANYFNSDEGPSVGEWGHYAVGWDGKNIITYYDGVPVGKEPFTRTRISPGRSWGASMLAIGGSDHQNLIGRIAQVRGYEDNNPRESAPESSFAPQTLFSVEGQLLSYFFRPAQRVADLSSGYNGGIHPGRLRGVGQGYLNECSSCPAPRFVYDPMAPEFTNPGSPGRIRAPFNAPPATPAGALIFDSFSRNKSTYILGGKGGLDTTEGGSAGPLTWQTSSDPGQLQPFGILSGHAVLLANDRALAWVSTRTGDGNLFVSVARTLGRYWSGLNTGLCFRVVDFKNYFFAYTSDDPGDSSGPKKLSLGYYQAGARTVLASGIAMPPDNWVNLRVETLQTGSIRVYADNELIYSTTSAIFADAGGAGLYNNGPGLALTNRWDNFTVWSVK